MIGANEPEEAGGEIVFWGCGGQAVVLRDILTSRALKLVHVISDAGESSFGDVPVSSRDRLSSIGRDPQSAPPYFAVAIGGIHGEVRLDRFELMKHHGLRPLTLVHPSAVLLSQSTIGEACQVLARAVIGVGARLGHAVIVNTGAIVDHETSVGSGSHVAPGSVLLGRVTLGERVFVGANATVLPDVTICADVVIGAGAVVRRDISRPGTYVGAPARLIEAGMEA